MSARARPPRPAALEWLALAIGVALVARYRWLFDDSFVYFRYVDNLLFLDAGLTFNAGEHVEGFTSPAHCLLLIGLRALHLGYPAIVLGVGIASFVLFWLGMVVLERRMGGDGSRNLPLLVLAASYPVTSFFTAGNEGPLLHLAAVAYALFLTRPDARWAALAVGASPLVRPELGLAALVAVGIAWWRRRRAPRPLLAALVGLNGAWLAFRVVHYADLLPNVFYLKVGTRLEEGSHLAAGLRYLVDAAGPPFLVLAALAGIAAWRGGGGSDARPRMLLVAAVVAASVVASGGSSMRYYYLAFPLTLAACATAGLVDRATPRRRRLGRALVLAAGAVSLAWYPGSLSRHPLSGEERQVRLPSREVLTDPAFFRHREPLEDPWPTIAELRAFAPRLAREGYERWTDVIWCNAIYANYDVRAVHGLGLTDPILARVDAPEHKRGHKPVLPALARDLIEVQMRAWKVGRGVYTDAIGQGTAPAWMAANAETIAVVERKMFHRHDPWENLRLALRFPPRIRVQP